VLVGGDGRDVLNGASGDDLIVGSRGADTSESRRRERPHSVGSFRPRETTLQFPRVTSGGGQADSLVLVNPTLTDRARGTLAFRDESGAAWALALNGQTAAAATALDIAPGGSAVFTTSSAGPLRAGSVRVTLDEGVVPVTPYDATGRSRDSEASSSRA
jgi:Ca2+-binding RTX toxin-like protein